MLAVVQFALSAIICGILYARMIRREVPEKIGIAQAITPVVLGVFALVLSFIFFLGLGIVLTNAGFSTKNMAPLPASIIKAFFLAGLPEELAKLLMILLILRIFRSKIRNAYEVMLVGAGVGLGFTLFEEFVYGGDGANLLRTLILAAHMVFGILMTRHLAQARFDKMMNQGSPTKEILLAIVIPVLVHTLYDAASATNKFLESGDENQEIIGVAIGIVGVVILFIVQILVLARFKKNTEKFCKMSLLPQPVEISDAAEGI